MEQAVPPSRVASNAGSRLTALIVASALFMQNLDSTVIATALPTMAHAYGIDPLRMNVALTSYLLSLAVFIPASGWMADRYGSRTIFRAAIAVFTVGSIFCGMANGLGSLVAARILQGIGGAMMVPVGRLVLIRSVAKSELVAAMAWLTVPALIGPVVGPPLGGLIVTYFSWRWIFYINVPVGIAGIVLVSLFVEEVRVRETGRLDAIGLLFCGTCLSGLMFGMETAGRGMVAPWITWTMIAGGSIAGLLYWLHARRTERPLLDFTLMRIPTFAISVLAGTLFRFGVGAVPFLLPMMLQIGFGQSAVHSGLITFASSAGALVMKPAATGVLRRVGFRTTLLWNGVISAILLAACALFRPAWPAAAIYVVLLTGGFFRSLQFTAFNTIAYADIPRERMSAATSLYSTIQQLSLTIGIALGAAVLAITVAITGAEQAGPFDFSIGFLVVAAFALIAAPMALPLREDAGAELSGHVPPPRA